MEMTSIGAGNCSGLENLSVSVVPKRGNDGRHEACTAVPYISIPPAMFDVGV